MPMKRHTMLYPNAPDTKKSKHLNLKACAKILPTQNHLKIGHQCLLYFPKFKLKMTTLIVDLSLKNT